MRKAAWSRSTASDEFDVLLESRGLGVAFQPIVELRSGDVVGYEALARPPSGSSFPNAQSLFAEAYRRGRVGELDWVCRAAVFAVALEKKVPHELPLFVNVEPAALSAPCPADIIGLFAAATGQCRFVVEVTERSLADDPAELLAAVGRTRDVSIGVALDDVGADPASLALMSLVAPDVIKLDLSLIQAQPNPEIARIVNAVLAESERTGAVILAEGVESLRHLAVAQSMGAKLGQGWYFGAPAPLPDGLTPPRRPLHLIPAPDGTADTPFAVASQKRAPVASTTELLAATSRHLENEILHTSGKSVLLSSFEDAVNFGPTMRRCYEQLARRTVLTAAFGRGMPPEPGRGIRGVDVHPDDPLCREWTVVVLGSQLAAALIARRGDDSDGAGAGQLEAVITHDRELVVAAAKSLLPRLPPLDRSKREIGR
jgi:EAL domain-containing protein (putative c-di-GMP-specific phosphodiesterase class I)